jgi:hypothetical protein
MNDNNLKTALIYRLTLADDLVVNFIPTGFKREYFVFEDSPYNAHMPADAWLSERKYMTIEQIEKQYDVTLPESIPSVPGMIKRNPNDYDLGYELRSFVSSLKTK